MRANLTSRPAPRQGYPAGPVVLRWSPLLLVVLLVAGCAREETVAVPTWTLAVYGVTFPVEVPQHFDRVIGDTPTTYALRATVTLPASMRARPLTFAVPRFAGRAALLIDGVAAAPLDAEMEQAARGSLHPRWRVPAEATADGALELQLEVEHRWTQSAWLDTVPRLSATVAGDVGYRFVRSFDIGTAVAALATALFVFLSYLLIFFVDHAKRAWGWFVLESLAGAMYPAYQLGLLEPLFGAVDAAVMATAMTVAAISSVHFNHAQLGLSRPPRAWGVPLAACVVAALLGGGPWAVTRAVAPITVAAGVITATYHVVVTTRAWRRGEHAGTALALLASWALFGVLGAVDFAAWLGMGELAGGARGAALGIFCIALLQSSVLSRGFVEARASAERLATELTARLTLLENRNLEVAVLGGELRRQIAARSVHIAESLRRMGPESPPPTLAHSFAAGDVVDHRYRIVGRLGQGATGAVYEALRLADGRRLAMKLLTTIESGADVVRFAREAHIVAGIVHPNVVGIVDVEIGSRGPSYIVMELVDGRSLGQQRARFRDRGWALAVLRQVAAGLAAVHAQGVVHRDLKPANVLVTGGAGDPPHVKLADFGISSAAALDLGRTVTANDEHLTETGVLMGTLHYMAPELAMGAKLARPAADVFSFGVMAYEMLAGCAPFAQPPAIVRLAGMPFVPPAPVTARAPEVGAVLAGVVERCLSEDPDARPTAEELESVFRTA